MPPPKRPRLRRIAKWTGLIGCVLIVGVWAVSLRWTVTRADGNLVAALIDGHVYACWDAAEAPTWAAGRWDVSVSFFGPSQYGFLWPLVSLLSSEVVLPLWLPLLVLAIPTAILWHRDRRRIPPGHCRKCGYDLNGNESGVCSECGTACQVAGKTN